MKEVLFALWKGLLRMLTGSSVACMFGITAYFFCCLIPGQTGYEAASAMLLAVLVLIISVLAMYRLGGGKWQKKQNGKFQKK